MRFPRHAHHPEVLAKPSLAETAGRRQEFADTFRLVLHYAFLHEVADAVSRVHVELIHGFRLHSLQEYKSIDGLIFRHYCPYGHLLARFKPAASVLRAKVITGALHSAVLDRRKPILKDPSSSKRDGPPSSASFTYFFAREVRSPSDEGSVCP